MKSKEEIYREYWNNYVTSLWGKEWATDKAFEEVTPSIQHIYEAMELYAQQKLNIASVVRPASDSSEGGELLPAEALEKSVSAGPCCCNNMTLGQTECDGLCVDIDEYD